jgi:pilus assembly protein FimV
VTPEASAAPIPLGAAVAAGASSRRAPVEVARLAAIQPTPGAGATGASVTPGATGASVTPGAIGASVSPGAIGASVTPAWPPGPGVAPAVSDAHAAAAPDA